MRDEPAWTREREKEGASRGRRGQRAQNHYVRGGRHGPRMSHSVPSCPTKRVILGVVQLCACRDQTRLSGGGRGGKGAHGDARR